MQDQKQSRSVSRVLSWTVIPLGASSPIRSSNLPGDTAGHGIVSLFGLAPGGVCRAGPLPDSRCALTAPFHPCHAFRRTVRRYLSVALSVDSRRPGVTWHRALRSPDFPPSLSRQRLSGRLRRQDTAVRFPPAIEAAFPACVDGSSRTCGSAAGNDSRRTLNRRRPEDTARVSARR